MAGRYPINMNIAFHNCQYNPFTLGIANDNPAFTHLCLRSGQPRGFYPLIREAPPKLKEYDIRFDDSLLAYLITIFIGNENQMVSVIIDTNMIDVLFPTNCCMDPECLQDYGVYFFNQSSSCLVEKHFLEKSVIKNSHLKKNKKKPNHAITNCYNFDCYTVQYTEKVRDREGFFPYGVLKKATVYDFISFDQDSAIKRIKGNRIGGRIPLILVLDVITPYAPYIPPTLGLAPGNTIGIKNFTIDFKNNKIKFALDENPKYLLNKIYNVSNSYTAKAIMIGIGKILAPITEVPVIFDTGNSSILLPPNIYHIVRESILSKSNIAPESKLWRGEIVQLNRIEKIVAPDILIGFETKGNVKNRVWKCIIPKENYLREVQRNRFLLLLGINNSNFINFGNCGMKNYKLGFGQSGNIFVY